MELPVFELRISDDINDEAEVNFVSLVDKPAVQRNWNAFKYQSKIKLSDQDKKIVSGVIMLPDTPIFRSDSVNGDYYVLFSKDTIFKIVQKYFRKGFQNNVNLQHDQKQVMEGVSLFESFISDKERGILPMQGFEDTPDGTWFGSMYVNNDSAWEEVKKGNVNGFSVEGIFEYVKKEKDQKNILEEIKNILSMVK